MKMSLMRMRQRMDGVMEMDEMVNCMRNRIGSSVR
jgi:hypothetical protein